MLFRSYFLRGCAAAAIANGASGVKCTATPCGYPTLEQMNRFAQVKGSAMDFCVNLRATELSRAVNQLNWLMEPPKSELTPFDNSISGDIASVTLDENDEIGEVIKVVRQLGYDLSDEDNARVYESFKRVAEKKQFVGTRELDAIVASTALQVPSTYHIENYVINSGNVITATANILLERNENYWGEAPYYDSIEFTFINDSASRVMSLQAGSVNIAADLSGADVLSIQDPYQVLTMSTGGCYVIFPNVTNEALSNELVRKAIALTINPEALNQIGSLGQGKIATSLVPSDNPIYAEPDDEYETGVNIEKAKELMEEAGYGDGFDLYMPTLGPIQVESQAIQADLLQIGINVKVEVVELPIYLMASDTGDLDLSYQCTTPDDIANMLNYFDDRLPSMSRGGGIIGGDPELYPLIDACRNDGTSEDWAAFQNYIRDHYLMIPVYENSFFLGADAGYTVRHDGIGYADFRTIQPAA